MALSIQPSHTYPSTYIDTYDRQKKVLARKNKWKFWTERKKTSAGQQQEENIPGRKEYLKDLVQAPIFSKHETILKFATECCTDDSVTKILLFKSWIEPVWEDKHNLHGGRFFLGCNSIQRAKDVFLRVISLQLGDKYSYFLDDSFVCGLALSLKENEYSVQIWHTRVRSKFSFPTILNRIKTVFPTERLGHLYHARHEKSGSDKKSPEKRSPEKPISWSDGSSSFRTSRTKMQLFPKLVSLEHDARIPEPEEHDEMESDRLILDSVHQTFDSVTLASDPGHGAETEDIQDKLMADDILPKSLPVHHEESSSREIPVFVGEDEESSVQNVEENPKISRGNGMLSKPGSDFTWRHALAFGLIFVLIASCVLLSYLNTQQLFV